MQKMKINNEMVKETKKKKETQRIKKCESFENFAECTKINEKMNKQMHKFNL